MVGFSAKNFMVVTYMSEALLNQITLDCLLNKTMFNKHLRNTQTSQINKEDRKFYRKRIHHLFTNIINGKPPQDLAPDVKYAYETFVKNAIQYFKTVDSNDAIQSEYNGFDFSLDASSSEIPTVSLGDYNADSLLMRSIKLDVPTLDKYVKRKNTKPSEKIILPQQKVINLQSPELKLKGVK